MAQESPFTRIVLIKAFNDGYLSELQGKLGRYTHIQSVNGIFLDGLSIETVTRIFRSVSQMRLQLLVRYIHPRQRLSHLPNRSSTIVHPPNSLKPRKQSAGNSTDAIPMPLFILGDNYLLQKQLFQRLQNEYGASQLPLCSPCSHTSAASQFTILSPTGSNSGRSLSSPISPDPSTSATDKLLRQRSQPVGDSVASLDATLAQLGSQKTKYDGLLPPEFTQTDDYIERAKVPACHFKIDSTHLPFFDRTNEDLQSLQAPPKIHRYGSTHPEIASPNFVLHMLKQSVDRNLAHLFLKPNGIYLIVIRLEDIVANPLLQYENLFYWLRLIHTHVEPADIRRIIIVGMYSKSELQGEEGSILECVDHLNSAIREQMKQNYNLPILEGGYIFIFDLDAPNDLLYLCACIQMCVEVFIDQAWYFQRQFFETVFTPFDFYKKVCADVVKQSRNKVVVRKSKIEQLYVYKTELPERFWETLKIYSSALCAEKNTGECE